MSRVVKCYHHFVIMIYKIWQYDLSFLLCMHVGTLYVLVVLFEFILYTHKRVQRLGLLDHYIAIVLFPGFRRTFVTYNKCNKQGTFYYIESREKVKNLTECG
jgi:hypothetical protein